MTKKISLKIFQLILLLLTVSLITFLLVDMSPIDPLQQFAIHRNMGLTASQKAKLIAQWDLNKSLLEKFYIWLINVLKGDFGLSHIYDRPVLALIKEGFSATFMLLSLSWLSQGVLGFILGLVAGVKKGQWQDKLISTYALVISATPTYWIAILLILIFSITLNWFPVGFGSPIGSISTEVSYVDRLYHAILPALTLSLVGTGQIILHTRAKVIETLSQDFILYQKSRGKQGLSLILDQALRNVALPAVTLQFMNFSELFSGAILAEKAFNYQGLGNFAVEAGLRGDLPLLLGVSVIGAIFVFIGNQMADLLLYLVNWRTGRESENG